jgi:histidine triad (HIT) family protein
MEDCIFCKIIKGEMPSYKVYEDDDVLAFLDITPVNPGHTLVISKSHHETLLQLPGDLACKLITVIKKITPAVVKSVEAEGFNLCQNNGSVSGQVVGHVHFHIIPRFDNDGHKLWSGKEYGEGRVENVLNKIKQEL